MPDGSISVFDLALDHFLDQVLQGDQGGDPPDGLDVGLVKAVRRLESLNHAPQAETRFADRLLAQLIDGSIATSGPYLNQPISQDSLRWGGRSLFTRRQEREAPMLPARTLDPSQLLSRVGSSDDLSQPKWRWAWRPAAQLATVALLFLTIVTGVLAFGWWQPGVPRSLERHLAAPDAQAPAAATPSASPESLAPLAEFVAEIRLGAGPSSSPAGMAVGADGTLYVIDAMQDQIRLFDASGHPVATWGETGEEPGQFRFHGEGGFWGDLAFGPDGNLYVLDPFNSRVQVLGPDGTVVREWGEPGTDEGQFVEPIGLDVALDGRVYVADTDNARVQIFDASGQFLEAWNAAGEAGGLPSAPANIDVDATGIVSVTDWNTAPIIRLDASGAVLDTFGNEEDAAASLAGPWGMASDDQGDLFVADSTGNRIQVFAPDGALLGTIGTVGVQSGQFISPKYVALSADGRLYVADEGNRRIQVFHLLPPLRP